MPDQTVDSEIVCQPETLVAPESPSLSLVITSWVLFAILGLPSLMMAVMTFDAKLRLHGPGTYLIVGWICTVIFLFFTALVAAPHLVKRTRS